jgi:RNA polymerase sigma-70 factor (ECF subfamily)
VFLQAHLTQQSERIRCWPGLLRRLATCRALDRLRQRRPSVPLDTDSLPAHSADGPEAVAIERELADRLRHAVAQLPRQEAAVFCLRYFDDLSYEQIAQTLHIQVGAVGVALHKARTRLEGLLLATRQET